MARGGGGGGGGRRRGGGGGRGRGGGGGVVGGGGYRRSPHLDHNAEREQQKHAREEFVLGVAVGAVVLIGNFLNVTW